MSFFVLLPGFASLCILFGSGEQLNVRRELYELLEGINRADSLAQVYESAMHFICSSLHCSRVAILLLDHAGVMRFVAAQGLSERYRIAVEGHSPWEAGATDPKPVCVPDSDAAPLEPPLQETIRAEGIRALAFIPLAYKGRLLGKFMIYFDRPHYFGQQELTTAQGIATQLAAAIYRRRADEALAADLKAMTHLQEFGSRAVNPGAGLESLLDDLLSTAISVLGADKGNLQLVNPETGALKIVAHRGFDLEFLKFFQAVIDQAAACAAAMQAGRRIIVEDVTCSPLFRNTQALQILLNANVRAVQSTPLVSREGKVLGMISTHFSKPHRPSESDLGFLDILSRQAADLFERQKAEQALHETKEQLARYNLELDAQVQRRTESLNEALSSLETLLYTIAHDLRAPNRAMQGYADLLANAHTDQLDEEGKFFVKRIGEAALKNEALIRDLLEYGRLSHAELPCQPVDPGKSIHAVLQAFEMEILAKKAAVEVVDQWPLIIANDSVLSHIMTNLLANALKYARPGVPSRVRIFPETIHEGNGCAHEPLVRLCVRDNGIGVPSDQWATIFEPFKRASNVNREGTGMGLAIVRKAAERMGGSAGVESNLVEGSTFWVELRKAP